ncbi:MAG: TraR/DksA family transcriptional regulator [Acidimicrobiales bacterium]
MEPLPLAASFDHASVLTSIEAELDAIDAALRQLDDGSYGHCTRCGCVLPPEALDADPLLVACQPECAR